MTRKTYNSTEEFLADFGEAEKRYRESDPYARAAALTEKERRTLSEADAELQRARDAVNTAGLRRMEASRKALVAESRAGERGAGFFGLGAVRPDLENDQRYLAAKAAVREAERELEDAQETAERVQRKWTEVHNKVSYACSDRRRKLELKHAPKPAKSVESPMSAQFGPTHGGRAA